jgi:transposase
MSKLTHFVGIDISKATFDAALISSCEPGTAIHKHFSQTRAGFESLFTWLQQQGVAFDQSLLFCMEYTGVYSTSLIDFLSEQHMQLWVEMPLRIKHSAGLQRGGDDKASAAMIALYAMRYQDRMQLWQPSDSTVEKIRHLVSQRDRIVSSISQLSVPVQELHEAGCLEQASELEKLQRPALRALQKTKQAIEELIEKTISNNHQINSKVKQVQSIKGIGRVTAASILIYTKGFTSFSNAKQLACYCGVVPFNKQSGTSVRYRPSVSPHANRKLKKLLHLCALSAIKTKGELRAYFERKVAEGKNKMSVINAIRNKLIHRVFAVLRDNRMYEENYVRTCA